MARFAATVLLSGVAALTGCDSGAPIAPAPQAGELQAAPGEPGTGRDFVFVCENDLRFTVRTWPGEVSLRMPDALGGRTVTLAATPAASGARYEADDVVYWNRGDEATIEIGGRRYPGCRLNPSAGP